MRSRNVSTTITNSSRTIRHRTAVGALDTEAAEAVRMKEPYHGISRARRRPPHRSAREGNIVRLRRLGGVQYRLILKLPEASARSRALGAATTKSMNVP